MVSPRSARRSVRSPERTTHRGGGRRPRGPRGMASGAAPALAEPPHAHIVCQQCGRITEVALTPTERSTLTRLAGKRPERWSVAGISFSLTGRCPGCRHSPGSD